MEFLELPIDSMEVPEYIGFLTTYFPNFFAEALAPIHPSRWPAYVAGSAMASEMPELGEKIQTPFYNFLLAKDYLKTAQSDIQWRDRFWQLTQDTVSINLSSEIGQDMGSFGAGAAANKIADRYMNEMV